MRTSFNLNSHWLSAAFWEVVFEDCHEQFANALPIILSHYERCEQFRARSGHDTGSISVASGVCLYAPCRHFRVATVAEVGTFTGKPTSSMALALAQNGPGGVIQGRSLSAPLFNTANLMLTNQ